MWITKILLFILIFASLYLLKEAYRFVRAIFSKDLTVVENYKFSKIDAIHTAIAFSYVLTIIITGFKL